MHFGPLAPSERRGEGYGVRGYAERNAPHCPTAQPGAFFTVNREPPLHIWSGLNARVEASSPSEGRIEEGVQPSERLLVNPLGCLVITPQLDRAEVEAPDSIVDLH